MSNSINSIGAAGPDASQLFDQFSNPNGTLNVDQFAAAISQKTGQAVTPDEVLNQFGSTNGTVTKDEFERGISSLRGAGASDGGKGSAADREATFVNFASKDANGNPILDANGSPTLDVNAFAAHLSQKTGSTVTPAQVDAFYGVQPGSPITEAAFVAGPKAQSAPGVEESAKSEPEKKAHKGGGGGGKVDDSPCPICGNNPCTCTSVAAIDPTTGSDPQHLDQQLEQEQEARQQLTMQSLANQIATARNTQRV